MTLKRQRFFPLTRVIKSFIVILCFGLCLYCSLLYHTIFWNESAKQYAHDPQLPKSDRQHVIIMLEPSLSPTSSPTLSPSTSSFLPSESSSSLPVSDPQCLYGTLAKYGEKFNKSIPIKNHRVSYIKYGYGCSTHHKYCKGKIKSIPCCRKILFDMWYKLDAIFSKYNVTYSFHWGSLLMAVRDGKHSEWDSQDLDLAFLYPTSNGLQAINEFISFYKLEPHGHHIMDPDHTFYKMHHRKYGYPSNKMRKYCFYKNIFGDNREKNKRNKLNLKELIDDEDGLILGGGSTFIDYMFEGKITDGMGNNAKHIDFENIENNMIPIEYMGSNNVKPPGQIYVYPDHWKHLYNWYGDEWMNGYTPFLTDKQIKYYGLSKFDNTYFKKIHNKTMQLLNAEGQKHRYNLKDERYLKFKDLFS